MSQLTVYTSASDGYAYIQSAVSFLTARNAVAGNVVDDSSISGVGQSRSSTQWTIWRSYLFFDTSALPDGAIISAATLSIYVDIPYTSGGHYDIVIQNGQPTYPHDPLEQGDYLYTRYSGDGGSINSEDVDFNWNDIILNSDGRGWINKTGTTKLCLRTSKDINGNDIAEGTSSFVQLHTLEEGSAYRAKLVIDYYTITATAAITTSITGTLTKAAKILTATAAITTSIMGSLSRGITRILTATSNIVVSIRTTLSDGLTEALSAIVNIATSLSGSLSRGKTETLTSTAAITISITSALVKISDILTSTANIVTSVIGKLLKDYISLTRADRVYTGITKADRTYTPVSDVTPSIGIVEDKFTWANIVSNYDTWLELLAKEHWVDWYFATAYTDNYTSLTTPSKTYTSVTTPDKTYKEVDKYKVDV